MTVQETVASTVGHVCGIDVHPVAVTLARVTYLLALGIDLLRSPEPPPVAIPVYFATASSGARNTASSLPMTLSSLPMTASSSSRRNCASRLVCSRTPTTSTRSSVN